LIAPVEAVGQDASWESLTTEKGVILQWKLKSLLATVDVFLTQLENNVGKP